MTSDTKMLNKWLYRRLPLFLRRRLTPQQSPFVFVVILATIVLILQTVSFISNDRHPKNNFLHTVPQKSPQKRRRPLSGGIVMGIDPKIAHLYAPDNIEGTFRCLSSNKKIPFDWINDDFCDCDEDGSDEPATGACQKGQFHCTVTGNNGLQWIVASHVNDGICDCCDGSDEWKGNQPLLAIDGILSPELQEKFHRYQTPCKNVCR